jgi:lipopolysaccharide transport protein LptA
MKFPLRLLFSLLGLLAMSPLWAQTAGTDSPEPTTAPPGSTVITSDELHSDQTTHTSIFTGNVIVIGTSFRMTCSEMTVFFTTTNKVDKIVATGDVVINQPNRVTRCGHAEYFQDEDKFILTDSPIVHDGQNIVQGARITIYRGGASSLGSPKTPPPTT